MEFWFDDARSSGWMKLSRRELACAALAALAGRAQTPSAPAPLTPEAELEAAKAQLQQTILILSQFDLPMATEPAFEFHA
jgi:hypothetical protein